MIRPIIYIYIYILFYSQFDINIKLTKREIISKNKMEERKAIESAPNDEYLRIVPIIAKYIKNKNSSPIFKYKCPLFAAAKNNEMRIYIFSNSLEHMGTFYEYKTAIICLCAISHKILASGSWDNTIKIWDIENRAIMSTLSQHTKCVHALCNISEGVFVSGSNDKSLIIWSKYELPGSSSTSTYTHRVLTGHKSGIIGIIRINNREIISGEYLGDLKIWDIVEGVCNRHIISPGGWFPDYIIQMKQHMGKVAVNYIRYIRVWGAINNWANTPLKYFGVCFGHSIEFLTSDILLRGGVMGQLEFIDYGEIGCSLPPPIKGVHSREIIDIQRIAKNIVATISIDGSLKVIDPISRIGYLNFRKDYFWIAAIAYFY